MMDNSTQNFNQNIDNEQKVNEDNIAVSDNNNSYKEQERIATATISNRDLKDAEINIDSIDNVDTTKSPKKGFKQILTFVFFSLGAGIIEFGTFSIITALTEGKTWLVVAEVLSVVLSCLFNFTLNRKYTFQAANNIVVGMCLYGLYYAIATPVGAWFIVELTKLNIPELLAKIIKMLLNFVVDFCYCKFFIFKIGTKKKSN